jgi:predicted unusual protein kinase regulating ubiquinone biosynthesis (AarF/ABC1/UbiB family)
MLRSGSICLSFLYNYLVSEVKTNEDENGNKLIQKADKLKCLSDTFQSYGGVLAKISQILCFEDGKGEVFSECKPYCQKETIEYIKNEYETNKDFFKNVKYLDFNVFKSGSVGEVHKGIYKDDKDIIIKVQYVGLYEQFQSDIFILDKVTSYLFYFADLSNAMLDIKTKLYEELDYTLEFKNQNDMFNIWKDNKHIQIAELLPELCTKNLLTMYYIDGENLFSFFETATQNEKDFIGSKIVEFIFVNFYKYGLFYSDIHYGNFLVKNKNILYVTDFGCINIIEPVLLNNLIKLHKSVRDEDTETFYKIVKEIGILKEDITEASKEYMYEYFKIQYEPWTAEKFEFTEEWLSKSVFKKTELMKEWILPSNCVYLNKIPYGAYHIFTKLNLKGKFASFFQNLIEEHDNKLS